MVPVGCPWHLAQAAEVHVRHVHIERAQHRVRELVSHAGSAVGTACKGQAMAASLRSSVALSKPSFHSGAQKSLVFLTIQAMGCHPWPRAWQKRERHCRRLGAQRQRLKTSWYGNGRCRNAAPHVGTCVVVQSSWTNNRPIFRTQEAQENQSGMFRAKMVIFAHVGTI